MPTTYSCRFPAVLAVLVLLAAALPARAAEVTVFAAASTTDALNAVAALFTARTGIAVRSSFAASSTLARQVEQGAPADLFLSADNKWMDYLADHGQLVAGSRRALLGNDLVLIAPAGSRLGRLTLSKGTDLAALLGNGRLAVGDPDHVPVGIYARQTLEAMGQWPALEPHLARAASVRAGLMLVERGEAPLGIVYGTDAAITAKVKVVGIFPAGLHRPIVYPVALVAGHDTSPSRAFLAFLSSDAARAVFARYGFTRP